jgi:hypothetical protein
MRTVYAEHDYDAPIETVYDWLAEPSNYATATGMLHGSLTLPGATGGPSLGAHRKFRAMYCLWQEEVTAYDRPHRFDYQVTRILPRARHHGATLEFTQRGGRVHVAWTSKYSMPVPLLGPFFEWAVFPVTKFYVRSILKAAARAA